MKVENLKVPALDIDKLFLERFNREVSPNGILERRIVAALIAHLNNNGFDVTYIWDTEETTKVSDTKSAMELIFNLDEAYVYFQKKTFNHHSVRLTLGEGLDIVCDWSYAKDDIDGFNKAMENFNTEDYA